MDEMLIRALSLFSFFLLVGLLLAELALLDADEYVLVRAACNLRVRYNVFCVLTCSHTQVSELAIRLAQLLKGALCLHDQIANEGANLNGWKLLRRPLDRNTIEVNEHVADSSWLVHEVVKSILDFTFLSSGLKERMRLEP